MVIRNSSSTLSYAVRYRVIIKYLGQLSVVLAALMLVPFVISIIFGEYDISQSYIIVITCLFFLYLPSRFINITDRLYQQEAFVIASLAFIMAALAMLYPMISSGLPAIDALFESISGITTTGLSTLVGVEDKPKTFLFARAWMQWCGGLGILVLSIAFFFGQHCAARRLIESIGGENLNSSSRVYARRMFVIYIILSLAGFILLWAILGNAFNAITYVLSAISTGGFSPHDAGVAQIDGWHARFAIIFLGFCGALPLPLFYFAYREQWQEVTHDIELKGLILACVIITALLVITIVSMQHNSLINSLPHSLFLAISAQTTTGFSTIDISKLDAASKLILITSMAIGGGVGSTAGGIKILRILILLRLIQFLFHRIYMPPQAVTRVRLRGKTLENDEIQRAMLLFLSFGIVILISWLLFIAYGYESIDALFEVVSATATVGLSTGISASNLPTTLKLILCIDMLAGRLEIIALVILLYPSTWFGKRIQS